MKKLFYWAAMTAMVLPMMVACNPNKTNDPDHPEFGSSKEWADYWLEPKAGEGVDITIQNLLGNWNLEATAVLNNSTGAVIKWNLVYSLLDHAEYLELTDNKYLYYAVDSVLAAESRLNPKGPEKTIPVKSAVKEHDWVLDGKTISLKDAEGKKISEYAVYVLEKNRLVLTSPAAAGETGYWTFTRIVETPKIPSLLKSLTGNSWRITKDSIIIANGPVVGTTDTSIHIIGTKADILPADMFMTFSGKEENGMGELVISEGKIDNEKLRCEVSYTDNGSNPLTVFMKLPDDSPYKLIDYYMEFMPFSNGQSGILWGGEYDKNSNKVTQILYLEIAK